MLFRCKIIGERDKGKSQPHMIHGDDDGVFEGIISHITKEKENIRCKRMREGDMFIIELMMIWGI